jgi:hypothetical protein
VTIQPAVHVWLAVEPTTAERAGVGMFAARDDGTIGRFRQWMHDNDIYPRQGTSNSGPGFYSGYFDAEHEGTLREYFATTEGSS